MIKNNTNLENVIKQNQELPKAKYTSAKFQDKSPEWLNRFQAGVIIGSVAVGMFLYNNLDQVFNEQLTQLKNKYETILNTNNNTNNNNNNYFQK